MSIKLISRAFNSELQKTKQTEKSAETDRDV